MSNAAATIEQHSLVLFTESTNKRTSEMEPQNKAEHELIANVVKILELPELEGEHLHSDDVEGSVCNKKHQNRIKIASGTLSEPTKRSNSLRIKGKQPQYPQSSLT